MTSFGPFMAISDYRLGTYLNLKVWEVINNNKNDWWVKG